MKKIISLLLILASVPFCAAVEKIKGEIVPDTLLYRGIDLLRARQKMQADPEYLKSERAQFIAACDKILQEPIGTILDKPGIAPSGDKHDYYTWANYYWPNPDTPDGKPYISKDGQENPERLKYTDEVPFMTMLRNVRSLAFCGYYT